MGNPLTKLRENIVEQGQRKLEVEERFHILEKMVHGRLENEKANILLGKRGDQELHSGTVVEEHRQVNIKMKEKPSQKIGDTIKDFFKGDFVAGLEDVVAIGANAILGNDAIGEYEHTDMFIVWTNNALLRCDVYYYRWNFSSHGVIDQTEAVVGVLCVKRVIRLGKVDPQVLTYCISNTANRAKPPVDASKMIEDALKVLQNVAKFKKQ